MANAALISTPTLRRSPSPLSINEQQRLSTYSAVSSSAASFQTAASSLHTVSAIPMNRDPNPVNPVPTPPNRGPHKQEIRIIEVTDNNVRARNRPAQVPKVIPPHPSQLPPSPPASIDHNHNSAKRFTSDESGRGPELVPRLQRASTETKASIRTVIAPAPPRPPRSRHSKSISQVSVEGHLQPPPHPIYQPTRRNTIGSTPEHVISADIPDELESDIRLYAENIRQNRISKRAQQRQEAEAALTRQKDPPDVVVVGNVIGEGHANYVLMYNMLTGIRIGVSRCQAKIKRPLTDEDFTARHKFSFDIVGNELTPSAKYDFKFKDYAPWVFRYLREDHFDLDPADYLLSLTSKYILSELGSPGKSGSFFYFSRDYRFIIKTIHHSEHAYLLRILKQYYDHVKASPHTLLSRFYGLHRIKLPRGRKIHFVIMNNIFPPHRDIHETYDLKGSTVGREYPEDKAQKNPRAVLKDLNWINKEKMLELGPEKRALLTEQLRRDAEFLKEIHVMDYSLLVGIHNMRRGNRDNVRRNTLKVFSPDLPTRHGKSSPLKRTGSTSPEAIAMRRAIYRTSDPQRLDTIQLPGDSDRKHFIFSQDEGGVRATDENNRGMDTIYYLGVIDILTPYGPLKKAEHFWKGLRADRHKISPVPPSEYSERFLSFIKAIMRGGEGGTAFKGE